MIYTVAVVFVEAGCCSVVRPKTEIHGIFRSYSDNTGSK